MLRNSGKEVVDNDKENSDDSLSPRERSLSLYAPLGGNLSSRLSYSLPMTGQPNGYIVLQGALAPSNPPASRANWMSDAKPDYISKAHQAVAGYLSGSQAQAMVEYLTAFPDINHAPYEMSAVELQDQAIKAEKRRLIALNDEMIAAHNARIDQALHDNGFINRVDLKGGVTAAVAVFQYIGQDSAIKALTKFGFIIVKIPPYTSAPHSISVVPSTGVNDADKETQYVGVNLPQQSLEQLHAELTYNNEFKIISQMESICVSETRPNVLAIELAGQKFIFNSPVFYDEKEFIRTYESILSGEYYKIFSSSESSDDEDVHHSRDIDSNLSDIDDVIHEDAMINCNQLAITGVLQRSFINLSCLMRRLAATNENPVRMVNTVFASILEAMNELHDAGFVHSDLACRNIVPRRNGTVALVDFGAADTLNKVKGISVSNVKYPQTPYTHNNDALKQDHLIGVITDYISFKKTFLQAISEFIGQEFYQMTIQNLPNLPERVTIEFFAQFTDRFIIDNVKNNLIAAAEALIAARDDRGLFAMQLIRQFEPYLNLDHNPKHTFAEMQSANNDGFNRCVRSAYVRNARERTAERLQAYSNHVDERQAAPRAVAPAVMSRQSTAERIGFFNRVRSYSEADAGNPLRHKI